MTTNLRRLLAAVRAAVRDPRRSLACLNACEGVDLDVIEVHDRDYNLQHVHDQMQAAGALCDNYRQRLLGLVGERNRLAAQLKADAPNAARYRFLRAREWDVAPATSERPARAAWECRLVTDYGMGDEGEDNLDRAVDELMAAATTVEG
jgi:hypothetical protein